MTQDFSPTAQVFLSRLNAALGALPSTARAEILREIESHLSERDAAGGLDEALAAMGPPELFARDYLADRALTQALTRPNPLVLLFAVLNRAGRSVLAFLFGSIAALLYLIAIAFAALVVLKAVVPANVGWWATPGHLVFGAVWGIHPAGPERLGLWILPIALGGAVGCLVLARLILKTISQVLLKRSSGVSTLA